MTRPPRRKTRRAALAWLIAAIAFGVASAPKAAPAQFMVPNRQVTLFGVLATPGQAKDDAKLKDVLPQLRTLLPGHSFKLLKVESKRMVAGDVIPCDLSSGFVASSRLISPLDANGKVQLQFDLSVQGLSQFQTIVTTPPNQISYINRVLPNGERLIIGLGAR
jgi:hypothetical protein